MIMLDGWMVFKTLLSSQNSIIFQSDSNFILNFFKSVQQRCCLIFCPLEGSITHVFTENII